MIEKMVHTAKQVVNATVLAVSARFCWEELMSDTIFRPYVFIVIGPYTTIKHRVFIHIKYIL